MKKILVIVIVVGVLGALGWQIAVKVREAGSKNGPGRGPGRRGSVAVAVEVSPVRKATIRGIGEFTGSLFPRSQFVVAPKIAGRLEKLLVDIGDPVKPGQLIAVLDDAEYVHQGHQARAEWAVAKASVAECASSLAFAESEFLKTKELYDRKIASKSELEETQAKHQVCEAKHKVALAQVEQRKAALDAAEVRLSYTQIRAAWDDGAVPRVVGERFVDEGEMLRANDPIISILDNRSMTAVIYVIERDYPKVRVGQEASIANDAFPEKTFTGKIVRIAPLLKVTSRQARVEIELPNPGQMLKPGMFIRAQLEFARHDGATVVPAAAVVRRNGKQGVFLADTGEMKAGFVPVTLGIVSGELAEVIKPPLSGLVVTMGHHLLEDGSAIRVPDQEPGRSETPQAAKQGMEKMQ